MWLEKTFLSNYEFYAKYHHDPINKIIHVIFVWPILATFLYLFAMTGPLFTINGQDNIFNIEFDYAFIIASIYILFYMTIEQPGLCGVFSAFLVGFFLKIANDYQGFYTWQTITTLNISCWVAQFIGHGIFEGRSPALVDNLLQAFLFAPLFVMLELWFMIGYKSGLEAKVSQNVETILANEKKKNSKKTK